MKKLYFVAIIAFLLSGLNVNAQSLLANYPLISDGVDVTGNNSDMTIRKAPFQNGGIYSNGIYYGNDTTGSHITTPQINNFDFDNLAVKVDFLLEEYPENRMPVVMCGMGWRWLSAWMDDDKLAISANNGSIFEISDVTVNLNEWHAVTLTYNKNDGEIKLYFDNVDTLTFEVDELNQGNDARVLNSDGGGGRAYKGYWKNLEIHNSSVITHVNSMPLQSISIKTDGNRIHVNNPLVNNGINLQMFDISGRLLAGYQLGMGTNSFNIPQENQVIMIVLDDQKGNRFTRKLYCHQ